MFPGCELRWISPERPPPGPSTQWLPSDRLRRRATTVGALAIGVESARMVAEADGSGSGESFDVDVVVVGAGFSGLYLLHRLRQLGFSTLGPRHGRDVGGTWYWNRYPGARCDIPTTDYSYSSIRSSSVTGPGRRSTPRQPEILSYLRFVADRYDLRRDIASPPSVEAAAWDESATRWRMRTGNGRELSAGST